MARKKIKIKYVMKYLLILISTILISCENPNSGKVISDTKIEYSIQIVNGHEYLVRNAGHKGYMAHSGECKKCKDELRKLIINCILECKDSDNIRLVDIWKEVVIDGKKFYVSPSGELN